MEYGSDSIVTDVLSHYSVIYALNDRENSLSYAMVEHMKSGTRIERIPIQYHDFGLFSTAATPRKLEKKRYIFNTRPEHYCFWNTYSNGYIQSLKITKSNFPVYGSREVILPGSEFICWVISHDDVTFPEIVTVGKKRGFVKVTELKNTEIKDEVEGTYKTPGPLFYDHLIENNEKLIEGKFHFAGHLIYFNGKIEGKYFPINSYGIPLSLMTHV